jgi:hypothetical protein
MISLSGALVAVVTASPKFQILRKSRALFARGRSIFVESPARRRCVSRAIRCRRAGTSKYSALVKSNSRSVADRSPLASTRHFSTTSMVDDSGKAIPFEFVFSGTFGFKDFWILATILSSSKGSPWI